MALILNIESTTTVCSVALGRDGELVDLMEVNSGYTHSENLTFFIQEILSKNNLSVKELDAIAISKGPGSYTGLRIGVSVAKGICYAGEKKLIAVDTLKHLTLALSKGEGTPTHWRIKPFDKIQPEFYTTDSLTWQTSGVNAKANRSYPTEAENIIWQHIRNRQLEYKFRRQHPIDKFIADFICIEKKLIIEIDGKIHNFQKEEDENRTAILNSLGYKVVRFKNEEVIANIDSVIANIKIELGNTSLSIGEGRGEVLFCPMLDARRMEVYCALYDKHLNEIEPVQAKIINEQSFEKYLTDTTILFFGNGAEKCKQKFAHTKNAVFIDNIHPSAANMISFSEQAFQQKKFEDLAYFEPYYLKEFVSGAR